MSVNDIYPWQIADWKILLQQSHRQSSSVSPRQALLLKGRQGTGKLVFARAFAQSLLCEAPAVTGEACGCCSGCRWFEQGTHPDFCLIEPEALTLSADETGSGEISASGVQEETGTTGSKARKNPRQQISVEQIRALTENIHITSHRSGNKVILIHPAEAMNAAAANALLKNLEEPPAQTVFILISHRPQQLLPTIISRCRQMVVTGPDRETALAWLVQQGVSQPEACLATAGGAPLAALRYDQSDFLARHRSFIQGVSVPEKLDPVLLAEETEKQKNELPVVVNWLQKWCYDLVSFRMTGRIRYHPDMQSVIGPLALKTETGAMIRFGRVLASTWQLSHFPLNSRLFLEEMLVSYARLVAPERY